MVPIVVRDSFVGGQGEEADRGVEMPVCQIKRKMEGCEKLAHELQKIKELADEIRKFLKIHGLDREYVNHISETQQPGNPIPELEEVMGNAGLRYDLICFLSYRTSVMQNTNDKWWGKSLIHDLDEMDAVLEPGCNNGKESLAWDMADLLKDLDYFKYAGYMQTGDHDIDPVRRIHTELMIPEKRQELAEYLTGFSQTEHENRIMDMVSSLRTLDQEQIKENRKTGHPSCRNAR
jgi:hypothetical protein